MPPLSSPWQRPPYLDIISCTLCQPCSATVRVSRGPSYSASRALVQKKFQRDAWGHTTAHSHHCTRARRLAESPCELAVTQWLQWGLERYFSLQQDPDAELQEDRKQIDLLVNKFPRGVFSQWRAVPCDAEISGGVFFFGVDRK